MESSELLIDYKPATGKFKKYCRWRSTRRQPAWIHGSIQKAGL